MKTERLEKEMILVCTNKKENGKGCGALNADQLWQDLRKQVKEGPDSHRVRVSRTGCLGRCDEGIAVLAVQQRLWCLEATDQDAKKVSDELINPQNLDRL